MKGLEMRNARFWFRWNGDWVKLTLTPGEDMSLVDCHRTEEGFSNTWIELGYDKRWRGRTCTDRDTQAVTCYVYQRARDCDGLTEHSARSFCTLDNLHAREPYVCPESGESYGPEAHHGPCLPAWEDEYRSSRDHAAEAAGY